jgi:hypothetical protein
VDGHRPVRLHEKEAASDRQMSVQPTLVIHRARGHDKPHTAILPHWSRLVR